MFGPISDSFSDSPATSSSSAFSSATCSPWETCPALAPASPELHPEHFAPEVERVQNSQIFLSPEHIQALVLEDLALSPLRTSVPLPFHDAGMAGSFQQMTSHPAPIDTSGALNNALDIDFSGNETPVAARRKTDFNISLGDNQLTPVSADGPSRSAGPYFSPSAPNLSSPQIPENTESNPPLEGDGFVSETLLNDRVERRRKSVRLVFSDDDEYMEDSDDDYYEDEDFDDDSPRKRRKNSPKSFSERSSTSSDYDDERRGSPSSRRSGTKGKRRSLSIGDKKSGAVSKRKTKRRHYCPRDGCQSSFTRYTDMERHLATVHRPTDTEANRCAFCRKAFSRDDAVLRHENDSCPMRPKKKRSGNDIWL